MRVCEGILLVLVFFNLIYMKKFLSVVIMGVLMLPMMAQALTARDRLEQALDLVETNFEDLQLSHVNYRAVAFLFEREVVKGYDDGTFRPDTVVNRAELTKMVVGMMYGEPDNTYKGCFNDVHEEWFAKYVCYAKSQGWIDGYNDGSFRPGNPVNRVEAMKIILNVMIKDDYWPTPTAAEKVLQMPKDADMGSWYSSFLRFAIAKELLDGQHVVEDSDGNYSYKPGESMSRKEVAEMMYRVYMYMMERVEAAELLVGTTCFQLQHQDITEQEAHDLWVESYLGGMDYTEDDADALNGKYQEDDVVDALSSDGVKVECGDSTGVDMSRWEDLKLFGM